MVSGATEPPTDLEDPYVIGDAARNLRSTPASGWAGEITHGTDTSRGQSRAWGMNRAANGRARPPRLTFAQTWHFAAQHEPSP